MTHIAERAATRALVAHDHEGGRSFAKALADIGTRCFFAHRHQIIRAQNILDLVETGGG